MATECHRAVAIAILALGCVGCGAREPVEVRFNAKIDTPAAAVHQQIYENTLRRFRQAEFISPADDVPSQIPLWMAPLIVQETPPEQPSSLPTEHTFGTLAQQVSGNIGVDIQQSTVYLLRRQVNVVDRSLDQLTYLWFYPAAEPAAVPCYRGVHMAVDHHGYGVIWEALSDTSSLRVFYVSDTVEKAAQAEWVEPLPGRRYAIEPGLVEHPDLIVARVLGDGPQPMGPYVYLDDSALAITTLLCRCTASQVDAFPLSTHYRLVEVARLDELLPGVSPAELPLPEGILDWRIPLRLPSSW